MALSYTTEKPTDLKYPVWGAKTPLLRQVSGGQLFNLRAAVDLRDHTA